MTMNTHMAFWYGIFSINYQTHILNGNWNKRKTNGGSSVRTWPPGFHMKSIMRNWFRKLKISRRPNLHSKIAVAFGQLLFSFGCETAEFVGSL